MGPRVPFVSNPFGAVSPNKVVETVIISETNDYNFFTVASFVIK